MALNGFPYVAVITLPSSAAPTRHQKVKYT